MKRRHNRDKEVLAERNERRGDESKRQKRLTEGFESERRGREEKRQEEERLGEQTRLLEKVAWRRGRMRDREALR